MGTYYISGILLSLEIQCRIRKTLTRTWPCPVFLPNHNKRVRSNHSCYGNNISLSSNWSKNDHHLTMAIRLEGRSAHGPGKGANVISIYYLSISLSAYHLSIYLSIIYLSVCLSVYLSIHPFIYPSISLSVFCLSYICLSICVSIHLSIYLSIYLSLSLSLSVIY
jgi:hypothetical protein